MVKSNEPDDLQLVGGDDSMVVAVSSETFDERMFRVLTKTPPTASASGRDSHLACIGGFLILLVGMVASSLFSNKTIGME